MGCSNSTSSHSQPILPQRTTSKPLTKTEFEERIDASSYPASFHIDNVNVRYAYSSFRGYYPDAPKKGNQDQYTVLPEFGSSDTAFFAVFDGHGKYGDDVSTYCKTNLHKNLLNALPSINALSDDDIVKILSDVHISTNKNLHEDPTVIDTSSGTTSISVLWHLSKLFISNVGDSRTIIVSVDPDNDNLIAKPLSNDQTPYRKDERERCKLYGARILTSDQLEGYEPIHENFGDIVLGEEIDVGGNPPRIWSPTGSYPGTAFTRSIGDSVAEEFGVIAEPEIIVRTLMPNDKYIVIASDGIWEFMTNQMVADLVHSYHEPAHACRALIELAYELWLQYEIRTDDITVIVLYLDHDSLSSDTIKTSDQTFPTRSIRPVRRRMSRQQTSLIRDTLEQQIKCDQQEEINMIMTMPIETLMSQNYVHKCEDEKHLIQKAISNHFLFSHLNNEQIESLVLIAHPVSVAANEIVIQQGVHLECFYIVVSGTYEAQISIFNEETGVYDTIVVQTYQGDGHRLIAFGDMSIMYGRPQRISLVAVTDGVVFTLNRHILARLIRHGFKRESAIQTLRKIKLFKNLSLLQLNKVIDAMTEKRFHAGEVVLHQGEICNSLFVIESGSCMKKTIDDKLQPISDYFFGMTLSSTTNSEYTIVAETFTILLYIEKSEFESVIGRLEDHMADISYSHLKRSSGSCPQQFSDLSLMCVVEMDDIKSMTRGTFQSQSDIKNVSIKSYVLNKLEEKWLTHGLLSSLEAALVLIQCEKKNIFVPKLLNSFVHLNAVHLVYSNSIVSDLHSLISECGAMAEEPATYIAACVVSAMEEIHSHNIIYRAFQPECLRLTSNGSIVLVDFDVCKIGGVGKRTYTICGAYDYVSPEQLSQEGHNETVDLWQLGVLLYEVTSGHHPFQHSSQSELYTKMSKFLRTHSSTLEYPPSVPPTFRSLIPQLMSGNPAHRLGGCHKGISALKSHQLFVNVPWTDMNSFINKSPLSPLTAIDEEDLANCEMASELTNRWQSEQSVQYVNLDNYYCINMRYKNVSIEDVTVDII